ncbi:carbohydrate-binding module family 50 protein [Annulohypoxylon maeteangense]|uniref:carbohydrate-binding module family 50 protein n=1 Tax=Annulohypoxylon maeteangense TaxID=1927788 RepID=UPI00200872FF|nr:carbohydrate-binding module family 50 protein [Annulohypoxylon maeteangense]KAI0882044.1 carbohydrate-binding module family 50 protein [Annulohypoxylon maeteangense]
MGRWSQYDTDEERLPEGMERIGYDADTQTYTFRDSDGGIWESAPGNRYGQLHRVNTTFPPYGDDTHDATEPLHEATENTSWRHEMGPLLNWFLLVGLFLLFIFWFISRTTERVAPITCGDHSSPYQIKSGDTCWAIAEEHHLSLDSIMHENQGLDCDRLAPGGTLCIPRV